MNTRLRFLTVPAALLCSGLLMAGAAQAAPQVSVTVKVERDVQTTDADGNTDVQRQEAGDAAPGETLYYTITYANSGDESATNVKLDNPVPDGASFIAGSAWGEGTDMLFSIDGGKSFKKAAALTYSQGGETRTAMPEQYNALRWVVPDIQPNTTGSVGFSVLVK
ncbi:DUF11 domain-containing protein [Alcanivorax sp. DP30]|uniref:DUF11 domain-containing protein n=1 Tax=Alcanivorax sp. DP30 TaxID=2606217 RepID=UPI00136D8AFC|nr:DUF11 domain-containing protein [Alcanivorax sp. DP30]MZR63242.1 DUF11 domain-containing protein [Alcanivorax sp. DP30]